MLSHILTSLVFVTWLLATVSSASPSRRPNIVMIMTDDQDRRLGSTEFQPLLQEHMASKGLYFVNHYATVAQCCPSRTALLRGQHAHNTNVTHVIAPGGNYDKFMVSGQNKDYLPIWLRKAGYKTEYLGKFLNGYNTVNYANPPEGWDHVDLLVDPYTYDFSNVVMSQNGEDPLSYPGYHQTDIIRVKTLGRLKVLLAQEQPFYIQIAPAAPHSSSGDAPVEPLRRHLDMFPEAHAPRSPSFNTKDSFQRQKSAWVKALRPLNLTDVNYADMNFQRRVESLQGIDELVEDTVRLLEEGGAIDNTYIIYTTDNGYHSGQFRLPPGKCLPFAEDTNIPFYVRGPGVPQGEASEVPTTHVDLAATFLDIAGLPSEEWPPFLDGSSALGLWNGLEGRDTKVRGQTGLSREVLNVEYWGVAQIEQASYGQKFVPGNSYKALRVVGEKYSFLYVVWCTNEVEMYDTARDPHEMHNLASSEDPHYRRIQSRLNALLLVAKSCEGDTCRDPWSVLQPTSSHRLFGRKVSSVDDALDSAYDDYFNAFPPVRFAACMDYQDAANEGPFYPANAEFGLGLAYRGPTDNYESLSNGTRVDNGFSGNVGTLEQRNVSLEDIMGDAVLLQT